MQFIPAIDLKDGACVRLLRGDFATVHTVASNPTDVARTYCDAGATLIHVVDLDGALDGKRKNSALVRAVADAANERSVRVELGGGLRSMHDLAEADALGVHRFVLGSAAIENPHFLKEALQQYGDRIVVGIDALDGHVRTRGWVGDGGKTDLEFAQDMANIGVASIIYTDISRDGTLEGPSLDRLRALRDVLPETIDLIASGGVSSPADLVALDGIGCNGAIAGKALYAGNFTPEDGVAACRYAAYFRKSPLIPAIVQDDDTNEVRMLGYMNALSLQRTLQTGLVTFWSRSRNQLWQKGETSGNTLNVVSLATDCDEDALLVRCKANGPTCHTGNRSCFYRSVEEGN